MFCVLIFMSATSENNKRIAKNMLFLYMRMLLIMGVTLYTSRILTDNEANIRNPSEHLFSIFLWFSVFIRWWGE